MATSNVLVALVVLYSLTVSSAQPSGTKCPSVSGDDSSCKCQPPGGAGIIDLTALSSNGTPTFDGIGPDPNDYFYTYNPCSTYTRPQPEVNECQNVYICQVSEDGLQIFSIGSANTEEIYIDTDGSYYVYYVGSSNREARVHLMCDQSLGEGKQQLTTIGDSNEILHYEFNLTSCHACPGGCHSSGNIAGPIGIVIIFLFLGSVMAYFIIGAIIMKFKCNASGTDIIPNKTFWFSLPGLIKDGCLFIVSPCVGAARRRQGYEEAKN